MEWIRRARARGIGMTDFSRCTGKTLAVVAVIGIAVFGYQFARDKFKTQASSEIASVSSGVEVQSDWVQGEGPALALSQTDLDFGDVLVGEQSVKSVSLTNRNPNQALTISSLFLDEHDSPHYSLNHKAPLTIEALQTIELQITFAPLRADAIPGRLVVNTQESVHLINLFGTGTDSNEPIIAAANPLSFPFGKSKLSGSSTQKPTSLQFGPDGRLYVALMDGLIQIFEIERTNANNYKVVSSETIHQIKNIQNHNDNGTVANHLNNRLVTGLYVTGTANQPVIYVHSSDPRIGGGPSGSTTNLDTNSGILSRLTKSGNSWQKLDLVRGLPRSEENHHTNGITANASGTKLYLAVGGNTNMGGISNNFAFLPEYALSAAILEIDLLQIGNSTYDLPTLDDEDRNGVNDFNDPFGGNRGKNQAKLVSGGPVQIYAPGFRNPYDVVLMQNGRMYSWDNGPNSGWGGTPIKNGTQGNCTNGVSEPGQTQHDALHLITGKGYYAGHANPTRGNNNNKFNSSNPQSPVPFSNPIECDIAVQVRTEMALTHKTICW